MSAGSNGLLKLLRVNSVFPTGCLNLIAGVLGVDNPRCFEDAVWACLVSKPCRADWDDHHPIRWSVILSYGGIWSIGAPLLVLTTGAELGAGKSAAEHLV